jgi:hypothetical protein
MQKLAQFYTRAKFNTLVAIQLIKKIRFTFTNGFRVIRRTAVATISPGIAGVN